jgi:NTP pyrophosphatase (non-canonical NTP hydrolase)
MKMTVEQAAVRTEPKDYRPMFDRLVPNTSIMTVDYEKKPLPLRLNHVQLGFATESGEFAGALKKYLLYGKPLDLDNLIEEMGDLSWYLRIGCDAVGITLDELVRRNIEKLKTRFPEEFTESEAIARRDKDRPDYLPLGRP